MPKGFDGVSVDDDDDDGAPKCESKIKALAVKLSGFWLRFVTGIGIGIGIPLQTQCLWHKYVNCLGPGRPYRCGNACSPLLKHFPDP